MLRGRRQRGLTRILLASLADMTFTATNGATVGGLGSAAAVAFLVLTISQCTLRPHSGKQADIVAALRHTRWEGVQNLVPDIP